MKKIMDMNQQYVGVIAIPAVLIAGRWEAWAQDSVVPGATMRFAGSPERARGASHGERVATLPAAQSVQYNKEAMRVCW